jgi:hypothetical protein
MAFKLGDVIIDRLQFGYGAKSNGTALYALTQLKEAGINITADSTDITDKDGNLVYRKYSGKKGEVTSQNAFMNLAVVETLSATDAEIATADKGIVMPMIEIVKAGKTLDITNFVDGTVVVNALKNGAMGDEYALGSAASATEFAIEKVDASGDTPASATLTPPTAEGEIEYIVKYKKTVYSGAKIVNSSDNLPTSHELYFKALAIDPCDKENLKAVILYIPSFIPSPEITVALQGGDSQTMDFNGAMMADTCSEDKELFVLYFIDEA